MTKKDYVLTILENIEQHKGMFPQQLQAQLEEVRQNIEKTSAESFFLQTNGVVTRSALQQSMETKNPLFALSEVYFDLKKIAEANRDTCPELISALTQYQGLTNESEGYSPE
ncbi:hypothetical protein [uncultured Brevibacillus sp.]|uniref:hypothetical protein n=1 Tax=uncultured Brevibacillus sp. TaxID=169970 RepID=UPI002599C7CC|nr:hypothetical protein [uncultured Brevibacillus sp.]